jgi:hypothetical protein
VRAGQMMQRAVHVVGHDHVFQYSFLRASIHGWSVGVRGVLVVDHHPFVQYSSLQV